MPEFTTAPEPMPIVVPDGSAAAPALGARLLAGGRRLVRHGLRRALDLVLPPVCVACSTRVMDPHALCAACFARVPWIEAPVCARTGVPFAHDIGPNAVSAAALADPPPYARARAAAVHAGVARDLVLALKYADRTELARMMARPMLRAGHDLLAVAEVIVPVPLHPGRLFRRRFNQAALLGAEIGRARGLPVAPAALRRTKATTKQVGLGRGERARNVAGAFRVPIEEIPAVRGRRVLLVDDVVTTGATVAACTRALKRAGAAEVDVLTFSRVVPGFRTSI